MVTYVTTANVHLVIKLNIKVMEKFTWFIIKKNGSLSIVKVQHSLLEKFTTHQKSNIICWGLSLSECIQEYSLIVNKGQS
jgi:hypothetical protein